MLDELLGESAYRWGPSIYRTILTTKTSGGAMSITDSVTEPGEGPPRHVHDAEDEAFIILTGEVEFWVAGERFIKGPGEAAFVPRGTEHTFRVAGDMPSRHIVILTPGGFEEFFEEMAAGKFRIPDDMQHIEESAARHNLRFTGPPLSADEAGR